MNNVRIEIEHHDAWTGALKLWYSRFSGLGWSSGHGSYDLHTPRNQG